MLVIDSYSLGWDYDFVRRVGHLGDKSNLFAGFGAVDEQVCRHGATHLLMLDGNEVYADDEVRFTRFCGGGARALPGAK